MKTKTTMLYLMMFVSIAVSGQSNWNTMVMESWSGTSWVNKFKQTNTFDQNNFLVYTLGQSWALPDQIWFDAQQTDHTNNGAGFPINSVTQNFDSETNTWINALMTNRVYNSFNKVTSYYDSFWIGDSWLTSTHGTNTYDSNGYLLNSLVQIQNMWEGGWINLNQTTYENNPDGSINQSIHRIWNTDQWENATRSTHIYNAANDIATLATEAWQDGNWVNGTVETYTYDSNDHLIKTVSQSWTDNLWQNDSQMLYTNDAFGHPTEIIIQSWSPFTSGGWQNESRYTFSYSLSNSEVEPRIMQVAPNPASDYIAITANEAFFNQPYRIIDVNGRIVGNGKLDNATIDTSDLTSGRYFIVIGNSKPISFLKN